MHEPLVSIVLGTYNGEKYLVQQLDSILGQSYGNIEIIISDDASTDRTREILKRYQDDKRVKIFIQEKNIGLSANYSFAAAKATGDLIAFSDQDDIWVPDKLEKLVANLGNSHLIYSDSILVDEQGNSLGRKLSDLKYMYSGEDSRGYFLYSCVWGHGMLITRKLLDLSLPFPVTTNHDIWISFKAFMNGGIKYFDEPLTYYRQVKKTASSLRMDGRGKNRRYTEYIQKLEWLELMKTHERTEYKKFYEKLYLLFERKQRNAYVFPLVPFMLKHRKAIFKLAKKTFASNVIEILKHARTERPR